MVDHPTHSYARLRRAMAPDPSRWYYPGGEPKDAGDYGNKHCACGHEVKWQYIIKCEDDDRELIIGSTCIEKNIPTLIEEGAKRLVDQVQQAISEHDSKLDREYRDATAQKLLPELLTDFKQLRNLCFELREILTDAGYTSRQMPQVLRWIEQVPKEGRPSAEAAAIRKLYVSMWLKTAQAIRTDKTLPPAIIPLPAQPQLSSQLTKAIRRAAKSPGSAVHRGARFAFEMHPTLPR
jgi:hypothetical protein